MGLFKSAKLKTETPKEKEKLIYFVPYGNQCISFKVTKELNSADIDDVETFIKCLNQSPLFNELKRKKVEQLIQQLEKQLDTLKAGVNT